LVVWVFQWHARKGRSLPETLNLVPFWSVPQGFLFIGSA
jgi:hypothetical protein